MLPELVRTSRERVSLVGMKVYFGALGAGVGLVGSGVIVDRLGFREMALLMALLLVITRFAGIFGVWRQARGSVDVAVIPFRAALRATFANTYFLLFLPSFVLFQVGFQMMTGVLPYYVSAVLGAEDIGTWVAVLSVLAASAVFPLLAFAGFLPLLSPEAQVLAFMVVAGIPLAGLYLFPTALIEKTATSLSPLLLSLLLLLGRSGDDPLGIRLVGPVAGLLVFGAWLVFRRYDLADDVLPPRPAAS